MIHLRSIIIYVTILVFGFVFAGLVLGKMSSTFLVFYGFWVGIVALWCVTGLEE